MKRRAQAAVDADEAAFFYRTVGHAPVVATDQPIEADQAPAAGPRPTAAPAPAAGGYTLEIDVAKSREEAEKLIDELHDTGIDAYYTPLARGGKVLYRVRRGIFASQRDAERAALAMRAEHAVEGKVIKLQ